MNDRLEKSIAIINEELGAIDKKLAGVVTDIEWLKRIAFWQLGIIATTLTATLGYLVLGP